MEQEHEASVVAKPAFRAVGLRWEGTFAEAGAGGIRAIHQQLQKRFREIPHIIDPERFFGLSYHARPDSAGFTHYAVVEVSEAAEIPDGMTEIQVPDCTYAKCEHRKGQSIDRSYSGIYAWMEQQGLSGSGGDLTHFEVYPMAGDPYDNNLEFTIMIPVATG